MTDAAGRYDVVVIGGGLGGLTAGALLAKRGRKVLLLERHSLVGGCATTFRRGEFLVEGGLHEMDGIGPEGDIKREIFDELALWEKVELVRLPEFYRVVDPERGIDFTLPDGEESIRAALVNAFPAEEKKIGRYLDVVHGLGREIARLPRTFFRMLLILPLFPFLYRRIARYHSATVGELFRRLKIGGNLARVLLANLGYYHDDPDETSLLWYAVAQDSYYRHGGWFIKGGSQRLSDALADAIGNHGGTVMTRHEATRIVVENATATGVEYVKTGDDPAAPQRVDAGMVIAGCAVPLVTERLLPECAERTRAEVRRMKPGPSILSLWLAFDRPLKEIGNAAYSTFLPAGGSLAPWPERDLVFVDYGMIDSGLAPAGKSTGALCALDRLEDWEGLDETAYRARKEEVKHILLQRLERFLPGVGATVVLAEVATPRTLVRYTANPAASPYGFAQIPDQAGAARIGHEGPVKGVYYASAWTRPGGGFTGAMLAGRFCADSVER